MVYKDKNQQFYPSTEEEETRISMDMLWREIIDADHKILISTTVNSLMNIS